MSIQHQFHGIAMSRGWFISHESCFYHISNENVCRTRKSVRIHQSHSLCSYSKWNWQRKNLVSGLKFIVFMQTIQFFSCSTSRAASVLPLSFALLSTSLLFSTADAKHSYFWCSHFNWKSNLSSVSKVGIFSIFFAHLDAFVRFSNAFVRCIRQRRINC